MPKFKLLFLLFIWIILLPSVLSWGSFTHADIGRQAIEQMPSTNLIKQTIMKNQDTMDACYTGLNFADVTVVYYYTSFETYKAMHDWNLYIKLVELSDTDDEKAFSYCFGLHLAADTISHNYHVPDKIRRYKIPNAILHPVTEIAIDSRHFKPEYTGDLSRWSDFIPLMKEATNRDWSKEASILASAISGNTFYQTAFAPPETTFTLKFYGWLSRMLQKLIPQEAAIPYKELSIQAMKEVLEGGHPALDPDGEKSLNAADNSVKFWKWLLMGASFIAVIFILRRKRLI